MNKTDVIIKAITDLIKTADLVGKFGGNRIAARKYLEELSPGFKEDESFQMIFNPLYRRLFAEKMLAKKS